MDDQSRFIVDTKTPGLDVSGELYRVYTFPGGEQITVNEPSSLWVKTSAVGHSHRLALKNGHGVYIPAGWLKIEWQVRAGEPAVGW